MRSLRVFTLLLVLLTPQLAAAGPRPHYSLDEMAARIQQQTGAQILSAEVLQTKNGMIYRFKLKKNGRVKVRIVSPDGAPVKKKRK